MKKHLAHERKRAIAPPHDDKQSDRVTVADGKSKRRKSNPGELPVYPSMRNCSARTGLPVEFLKKISIAGCPAFDAANRVDLNKLLPWIPTAMESSNNLPPGFATSAAWLNSVKAQREDIRLRKERGEVLDRADVMAQASAAESYYGAELDRMLRELPPALTGLTAMEILERLKQFVEDLRVRSRENFKVTK